MKTPQRVGLCSFLQQNVQVIKYISKIHFLRFPSNSNGISENLPRFNIFYNSFGCRLEHSDPVFKKISYREYEVDFKKEKPANTFAGKQE